MSQIVEKMLRTPNIELTVKNKDTLTQFFTTAYLDPDYLAKAQKWVNLNKFTCDETLEDLQLSVGEIFNFTIPKSSKQDA
jgi:hypothetical protein